MRTECLALLLAAALTPGLAAAQDPNVEIIQLAPPAYRDGDLAYWSRNDEVYRDTRHLAELGEPGAQYDAATMAHFRGETETAMYWYRRAAGRGNGLAAYNLATIYCNGDGVPADDAKGAYWMERAAALGLPLAQFELAKMYYQGRGVETDHGREAYWYRQAAENGNSAAAHNLAVMYHKGEGVRQDDGLARQWLERARSLKGGGR